MVFFETSARLRPTPIVNRLSSLADLLEEAFHRGWDDGTARPGQRLGRCLRRRETAERAKILDDLRDIQARALCDMQLADLIAFELACDLRPAQMGLTPAEWLDWVGREVASAGSDRGGPALAGPDADALLEGPDEDLAVSDLT